jgi:hypothetical protein
MRIGFPFSCVAKKNTGWGLLTGVGNTHLT